MKTGKANTKDTQTKKTIIHKTQVFFMYFLYEVLVAVKLIWRLPLKGEVASAKKRAINMTVTL